MTLTVTPEQFQKMQTELSTDAQVQLVTTDGLSGTLKTGQVDLSYSYDGTANLAVDVVARHGFLAEHAPESLIEDHIRDFFQKFLASDAPETETEEPAAADAPAAEEPAAVPDATGSTAEPEAGE